MQVLRKSWQSGAGLALAIQVSIFSIDLKWMFFVCFLLFMPHMIVDLWHFTS